MPDSVSALHAANATQASGATGPALPPREQPPIAVPSDADVIGDITNIDKAQKTHNQAGLKQYSEKLVGDLVMQENDPGKAQFADAIENGKIRTPQGVLGLNTPQGIKAFNTMIMANAVKGHTIGPATIQVDDLLASAASSAPGAGAPGTHESPPTSAMISSASSQGQQMQAPPSQGAPPSSPPAGLSNN